MSSSEPLKALDCFLEAASGLSKENFLMTMLQTETTDPQDTEVMYYLKVGSLPVCLSHANTDLIVILTWMALQGTLCRNQSTGVADYSTSVLKVLL